MGALSVVQTQFVGVYMMLSALCAFRLIRGNLSEALRKIRTLSISVFPVMLVWGYLPAKSYIMTKIVCSMLCPFACASLFSGSFMLPLAQLLKKLFSTIPITYIEKVEERLQMWIGGAGYERRNNGVSILHDPSKNTLGIRVQQSETITKDRKIVEALCEMADSFPGDNESDNSNSQDLDKRPLEDKYSFSSLNKVNCVAAAWVRIHGPIIEYLDEHGSLQADVARWNCDVLAGILARDKSSDIVELSTFLRNSIDNDRDDGGSRITAGIKRLERANMIPSVLTMLKNSGLRDIRSRYLRLLALSEYDVSEELGNCVEEFSQILFKLYQFTEEHPSVESSGYKLMMEDNQMQRMAEDLHETRGERSSNNLKSYIGKFLREDNKWDLLLCAKRSYEKASELSLLHQYQSATTTETLYEVMLSACSQMDGVKGIETSIDTIKHQETAKIYGERNLVTLGACYYEHKTSNRLTAPAELSKRIQDRIAVYDRTTNYNEFRYLLIDDHDSKVEGKIRQWLQDNQYSADSYAKVSQAVFGFTLVAVENLLKQEIDKFLNSNQGCVLPDYSQLVKMYTECPIEGDTQSTNDWLQKEYPQIQEKDIIKRWLNKKRDLRKIDVVAYVDSLAALVLHDSLQVKIHILPRLIERMISAINTKKEYLAGPILQRANEFIDQLRKTKELFIYKNECDRVSALHDEDQSGFVDFGKFKSMAFSSFYEDFLCRYLHFPDLSELTHGSPHTQELTVDINEEAKTLEDIQKYLPESRAGKKSELMPHLVADHISDVDYERLVNIYCQKVREDGDDLYLSDIPSALT